MSNNAHRLKGLEAQLAKAKLELDGARIRKDSAESEVFELAAKIRRLEKEAEELAKAEPCVTDHALLRYLDRVSGIGVEHYRSAIITPKLREQINKLGSGTFPLCPGFVAVVRKKVVITIRPS